MTYTFITEKSGSTIIEQFDGVNVSEAAMRWHRDSECGPSDPLDDEDDLTLVRSVRNVWCTGGHDRLGVFYLVHIVATAAEEK